ncbi:MAG: VOC family protein [Haloechinothrix sp.]
MTAYSHGPARVLPPGSPCWIDLATTNMRRARAFYSALFGWTFSTRPDPATATYTIATLGGVQVAGMYRAVPRQSPGWMLHLAVHNARMATNWVTRLGGQIMLAPVDIPDRGTILHVRDPSGAAVVLWQTPQTWQFGTAVPGTFSGTDLNTHDGEVADIFYCKLFGLTSHQIGWGQRVDYAEWRLDEPVLHRYVMGPEFPATTPAHWMIYLKVDPGVGTDALAGHAKALGGAVVIAPFDTSFGRTAVLADPAGATFAIIDRDRIVEEWSRAEVDDPYAD